MSMVLIFYTCSVLGRQRRYNSASWPYLINFWGDVGVARAAGNGLKNGDTESCIQMLYVDEFNIKTLYYKHVNRPTCWPDSGSGHHCLAIYML